MESFFLSDKEPSLEEHNEGVFWWYWSIAKPANLSEWAERMYRSDSLVTTWQLQSIYADVHQSNAGFYLLWLTQQSTVHEEVEVDVMWKLKTSALQYRVAGTTGAKLRGEAFSPDGSNRTKLALQNAHCPALKILDPTW